MNKSVYLTCAYRFEYEAVNKSLLLTKIFLSWKAGPGQPQNLGSNFSMWMLLERVRFTLDGLECNKIGVSYEAFNGQPNFCASPFWSCLHNQLANFWEVSSIPHSSHCTFHQICKIKELFSHHTIA